MPNDRSTERLLQRKRIAEEAGKAHPGEWGTDIRYNLKMTAVCADNGEPLCIMTDDEDVATATHIALSDPGITQQDIEEIIKMRAENERLREENKRLCGELEMVHEEADWLAESLETESPYCDECEFKDEQYYDYGENVTWCAHAPDGTNDTCDQSWRKAARKAVEEERNG
nr:MAG TPA: Ead/Ea22-like protein [Caudoviricetes sp.]